MPAPTSTWFVKDGLVIRMDGPPVSARWSEPRRLVGRFAPLAAAGATGDAAGVAIAGGFQHSPTELTILTRGAWVTLDVRSGALAASPPMSRLSEAQGWSPVCGTDDPSRVLVLDEQPGIYDPIANAFSGPAGTEGLPTGPNGDATAMLPDGRLYVFGFAGFRVFDAATHASDGVEHPYAEAFGPLVAAQMAPPAAVWSATGVPAEWPGAAAADVPHELLAVLRDVAAAHGLDELALTLVADLEAGLRPDAYRPAGRFGLFGSSAGDLAAAGVAGGPETILGASPDVLRSALGGLVTGAGVAANTEFATLWAELLTRGDDHGAMTADTVVAAPGGPHPDVWASHAAADVGGDGQLTVADLEAFAEARAVPSRLSELERRLRDL